MSNDPPFTCPRCGCVSYHPTDAAERYCGACHAFVADEPPSMVDRFPRWPGPHVGPVSVDPGLAPGGWVVHVYDADGTLLTTRYLTPSTDLEADATDAVNGLVRTPPGTPVLLVMYDGDTGVRA